ncbi:MAG TPA: aminoglycoside phosphotransferase family protein [Chitinophagaceae bacterium]
MIESVLEAYGIKDARSVSFGNGLIHHTWKVITPAGNFILQKIQDAVFKRPQDIAYNIRTITGYLRQNFPDYLFVTPIVACNGDDLICMKDKGYFRMFPFVEGSHSKDIVQTAQQAYEAAAQFGKFTRLLSGFDVNKLKITIPGFHNLDLRYRQLQYALKEGNAGRISQSKDLIEQIARKDDIVSTYNSIHHLREFKLRATHHDTKISNVLFDKNEKAICVIDLDTVMAGYFISDVGDMMRTYLSPVSEEEKDFEKITIRDDFYKGIVEGYAKEMDRELSATESQYFFYAGMFMIYMQAIRFLTDHLNNDIYYGAKYDGQNFVRAGNQMALLERLMEKEEILK